MSIRMTTPISQINGYMDSREQEIKQLLVKFMCRIGEECVKDARLKGSYKDQTANLRSSIGYVVLLNGVPVQIANPQPSGNGSDKMSGVLAGSQYLKELSQRHSNGEIVLIVAAGMNYAYYVESIHNRVVLSSAEMLAPMLKNRILSELGLK